MTPRQEAIAAGLKRYEGKPCKRCGGTERQVSSKDCVACHREAGRRRREANPEKVREAVVRKEAKAAREAARAAGLTAFEGSPCGRCGGTERYVSGPGCVSCVREAARRRADTPEKREAARRRDEALRNKKAAATTRAKRYEGKPCPQCGGVERWVSNGGCVMCAMEAERRRRAAGPERDRAAYRIRRAADPEKYRETDRRYARRPLGQLRTLCKNTAARLGLGSLSHSRLKLLGYTAAEWKAHLESQLPNGWDYDRARAEGWHLDHMIPLAQVLPLCNGDAELAFRAANRLENLWLAPAEFNCAKGGRPALNARARLLIERAAQPKE